VFLFALQARTADVEPTDHPNGPHHPPTTGQWVGDHWTPYDPPVPESFPEGTQVYRIRKTDTLWDLANQFYSDPYLWPQIWDANRYILDSHWIYPGDPLLIPGRPTVISEVLPQVEQPVAPPPVDTGPIPLTGPGTGPGTGTVPGTTTTPTPAPTPTVGPGAASIRPPQPITFADYTHLECLGSIVDKYKNSKLFIAQSEEPAKIGFATGDIVYLNGGVEDGISPGDEYSVVKSLGMVEHPITGKRIGDYLQRLGRLRVVSVQEETSIARIEFSCYRLTRGMDLIPYDPLESPAGVMPEFAYDLVESSGEPQGYIIHEGGLIRVGTGQFAQVDLGTEQGAAPGDFITVFVDTLAPKPPPYKYKYKIKNQQYKSTWRQDSKKREWPRRVIGHAVIVTASSTTSVVKVLDSIREIEVGDRVELQ
jgi:hypothetical protein